MVAPASRPFVLVVTRLWRCFPRRQHRYDSPMLVTVGDTGPRAKNIATFETNRISTIKQLLKKIMSNGREYAREHLHIVCFILRTVVELLFIFKNK